LIFRTPVCEPKLRLKRRSHSESSDSPQTIESSRETRDNIEIVPISPGFVACNIIDLCTELGKARMVGPGIAFRFGSGAARISHLGAAHIESDRESSPAADTA